jgi:hypothetical protein
VFKGPLQRAHNGYFDFHYDRMGMGVVGTSG